MDIPTLAELARIAPTSAIILIIAGLGYWRGYQAGKSQGEAEVLREWLNTFLKK